MGSSSNVVREVGGDLLIVMEKHCMSIGDPGGKQSSVCWREVIDGLSMLIGKYVYWGLRREFLNGLLSILMAFNV
jgi:hypothetical protein